MLVRNWVHLSAFFVSVVASGIGATTMVTGQPGYRVFGVAIVVALVLNTFVLGRMWDDVVHNKYRHS
jgi:hypothetical protein